MSFFFARAVLWAAVLLVLAAAAAVDLRRRIIPNETVALVAAGGIALGMLSWPGAVLLSLVFGVVVLLALLVCAHFNVLGAGDAKLIAAVTLLTPPEHITPLLMAIALAGGLLSGVYLAAFHGFKHARAARHHGAQSGDRHPIGSFAQFRRAGYARMRSGYSVPYALAVLCGVVFYLVNGLYQCSSAISCSL